MDAGNILSDAQLSEVRLGKELGPTFNIRSACHSKFRFS